MTNKHITGGIVEGGVAVDDTPYLIERNGEVILTYDEYLAIKEYGMKKTKKQLQEELDRLHDLINDVAKKIKQGYKSDIAIRPLLKYIKENENE